MTKKKIYGLRVAIGLMVFLFFKITSEAANDWSIATLYSVLFTTFIVLIIFEVIDFTGRKLIRKYKGSLTSYSVLFKFYLINCIATAPFVLLASVVHTEVFIPYLLCPGCPASPNELTKTIAQGLVLSWLIISAKTFITYMEYTRKSEREKSEIQQELALSKFESLKDQIQPHFLFNSFSVLTAIIEEDPKLAVEFVAKLSKIYRYVLDNKSQLVDLKTELEFLDHYIFLLKTRHRESIQIDIKLEGVSSLLPILSLQMLVENALKHNYFSKETPLNIDLYAENGWLIVTNNLNKRSDMKESTKFGLQNIQNRYELLLERSIEVVENKTSFTVKLPLITNLDELK